MTISPPIRRNSMGCNSDDRNRIAQSRGGSASGSKELFQNADARGVGHIENFGKKARRWSRGMEGASLRRETRDVITWRQECCGNCFYRRSGVNADGTADLQNGNCKIKPPMQIPVMTPAGPAFASGRAPIPSNE